MTLFEMLPIFKALADETRLQILTMLENGKMCACRINDQFDCSQPTISYHMRLLTEAGLVTATREGALVCYELTSCAYKALRDFANAIEREEAV